MFFWIVLQKNLPRFALTTTLKNIIMFRKVHQLRNRNGSLTKNVMFGLIIAIVYLAFISLGLPDSLLGAAWPTISAEMSQPISAMGIITMIISGATIVSSIFSNFLIRKLGTGLLTALSVALTAAAMFGFSFCTRFWHLCLWAVPYGLGAGAIDAALNNYAAIHFSSRHMNWLHCFWGVGVSISPYIMGACLTGGLGWQGGYRTVGAIQIVLTLIMFCALPLWKKAANQKSGEHKRNARHSKNAAANECLAEGAASSVNTETDNCDAHFDASNVQTDNTLTETPLASTKDALKVRGVWFVFVMFFCYCAMEQTAMQWASTYLVAHRGISAETAATFATLFCTGITAGRFLSGIFSDRLGDKRLIRIGSAIVCLGIVCLCLPQSFCALAAFVLIGLGCAPIYPAVIHSTPTNFGEKNSQAIVGVQMAFAYVGSTFMPPLFGTLVEKAVWVLPLFLGILLVTMAVLFETVNSVTKKNPTARD